MDHKQNFAARVVSRCDCFPAPAPCYPVQCCPQSKAIKAERLKQIIHPTSSSAANPLSPTLQAAILCSTHTTNHRLEASKGDCISHQLNRLSQSRALFPDSSSCRFLSLGTESYWQQANRDPSLHAPQQRRALADPIHDGSLPYMTAKGSSTPCRYPS